MANSTRITKAQLKKALEADYARLLEEAEQALNQAPAGAIIRASEEPFRDALARFRRVAFQKAIQLKADAAQAAFPPSGPGGGATSAEQGHA
jgi:hypothetical protein